MMNARELIKILNTTDECSNIEAKKGSDIGKAILETVCAYSNEPDLGGGYLLLGVEKEEITESLFPEYVVTGIPAERSDKIQSDLASQCGDIFNRPVRPQINVETINNKLVIVVFIEELSSEQKPLYFKNRGLPQGAYRRIGSSDVKGTEDDLSIYFQSNDSFDSSIVKGASLDDLSDDNIQLYRKLRAEINPLAEELSFDDRDLLTAVNAITKNKSEFSVTYTGLLVFGNKMALRRLLPMVRVDYIRVSSNDWIGNPDERFTSTLDMRGSLLELVQRVIHTIGDDLPKGFELTDENIQAKNIGLPLRVLREAVVNALIHRSYRENSPIQIIRYPNRIEISNPGFSLKNEEQLGEPGSINRNPFIATIFHETNLAETKGSGIRIMRALMEKVGMMPPTFESDRGNNKFTARLLLHHLLNEDDLNWLAKFSDFKLNDNQKRILIFVREVNAVDNYAARQINGYEGMNANADLRKLRELQLLESIDKGRYTYYLPSSMLLSTFPTNEQINSDLGSLPDNLDSLPDNLGALPDNLGALPDNLGGLPDNLGGLPDNLGGLPDNLVGLSAEEIIALSRLKKRIDELPERINDKDIIPGLIVELCKIKEFRKSDLAKWIGKNERYLFTEFIKPLLDAGKLEYKFPDMLNHPDQAYKAVLKNK